MNFYLHHLLLELTSCLTAESTLSMMAKGLVKRLCKNIVSFLKSEWKEFFFNSQCIHKLLKMKECELCHQERKSIFKGQLTNGFPIPPSYR